LLTGLFHAFVATAKETPFIRVQWHTRMSDDQSRAEKYRREAMSLRQAAAIVRDPGLRDQLLSIAEQYEVMVAGTDRELLPQENLARRAGPKSRRQHRMAKPDTATTERPIGAITTTKIWAKSEAISQPVVWTRSAGHNGLNSSAAQG
jgi:hypothetical protein